MWFANFMAQNGNLIADIVPTINLWCTSTGMRSNRPQPFNGPCTTIQSYGWKEVASSGPLAPTTPITISKNIALHAQWLCNFLKKAMGEGNVMRQLDELAVCLIGNGEAVG